MDERLKRPEMNHETLRDQTARQYEAAMLDCMSLGFGFIIVKRVSNSYTYEIKHAPWSEVKTALEELGVLGSFGGRRY